MLVAETLKDCYMDLLYTRFKLRLKHSTTKKATLRQGHL